MGNNIFNQRSKDIDAVLSVNNYDYDGINKDVSAIVCMKSYAIK